MKFAVVTAAATFGLLAPALTPEPGPIEPVQPAQHAAHAYDVHVSH